MHFEVISSEKFCKFVFNVKEEKNINMFPCSLSNDEVVLQSRARVVSCTVYTVHCTLYTVHICITIYCTLNNGWGFETGCRRFA